MESALPAPRKSKYLPEMVHPAGREARYVFEVQEVVGQGGGEDAGAGERLAEDGMRDGQFEVNGMRVADGVARDVVLFVAGGGIGVVI